MSSSHNSSEAPQQQPIYCLGGCGFYGNPLTENLCSKCFKEKAGQDPAATSTSKQTQNKNESQVLPESSEQAPSTETIPSSPAKPIQEKKDRCWKCNKKLGLMSFSCRCEYSFCSEHRYAEAHSCTFDYKTDQRNLLKEQNPTVAASKLNRI
eukprot:c17929_g1_i2.p1 GENE.c17929_g1_i2~~c17929_g1_i2.p1  ORF type:complete len:152 (-),score=34.49 c17929_g1_i2:82-537(-)